MRCSSRLGLREGGFGIMLARGLVDEFRYNQLGNEVTLVNASNPNPANRPRPPRVRASFSSWVPGLRGDDPARIMSKHADVRVVMRAPVRPAG